MPLFSFLCFLCFLSRAVHPLRSSFSKIWTVYRAFHSPLWKWQDRTKSKFFRVFETWFMQIKPVNYLLTCIPYILNGKSTTDNWINDIRRMIIKTNSVRWCKTIKHFFWCSTNNPILCRKSIFHLRSFRFTFVHL